MPGNPGLLPGVSHIAASCTHALTHTHMHTCQLYKELLAPFPKAKKKRKEKKNPSLGYFKKKDFCIFSSLEICKGLENSSLSWGNFMNTLHRSVFYTEASHQTQAKPWKTAAECTQAPPSLRQASQQSPASCAPPPRWVRSTAGAMGQTAPSYCNFLHFSQTKSTIARAHCLESTFRQTA